MQITSIQIIKSWILDLNSNCCATGLLTNPKEHKMAIATPCHQVKNTIDLNVRNLANGLICANSFFVIS